MFVHRLTIWFLVILTSGLVGLSTPTQIQGSELYYPCNTDICVSRQIRSYKSKLRRMDQRRKLDKQKKSPSEPSKIRIRGLSGSISSGTTTVSNTSTSLIWNSWGIGQSVLKYKTSMSDTSYDVSNTSTDLSYTFGDEWTLTLGLGSVSGGKGTITSSSKEYTTSKVSGSGYFGMVGVEFGIFEVLVGYRKNSIEYKNFQGDPFGTTVTLDTNYKVSGGLLMMGLGLSF